MDKRRQTSNDGGMESDKQFLDRIGLTTQLRDALTKLVENRPENPICFLADFFEGQGNTSDRVSRAHQQLTTTHYSKPAFHSNVRTAFDLMSYHKRRTLKGVTGAYYMELLSLLCSDFPEKVKQQLLKKLMVNDYEVIVFDIFKSSVFTCLVLADFIEQAKGLYRTLDTQNNDKVDRVICDTLSMQLHRAVDLDTSDVSRVIEAGHMLGPDKTYASLATALFNSHNKTTNSMTCEAFVTSASDAFLSKVNTLR